MRAGPSFHIFFGLAQDFLGDLAGIDAGQLGTASFSCRERQKKSRFQVASPKNAPTEQPSAACHLQWLAGAARAELAAQLAVALALPHLPGPVKDFPKDADDAKGLVDTSGYVPRVVSCGIRVQLVSKTSEGSETPVILAHRRSACAESCDCHTHTPSGSMDSDEPAAKKKSESQELRMAEKSAKNLIVLIQRAQQVVDTITGHVDSFPSEWAWSKSFLEEFHRLQGQLRTALSPASGDDLTEFVNELKISVISPSEAKQMKKKFGERYQAMLTLFVDRCTAVSEQFLGFNNLFPGPATLAILK